MSLLTLIFVFLSPIEIAPVSMGAATVLPRDSDTTRVLEKEILIRASLDRVWHTWTTEAGIEFLSPISRIDLRPGGPFELFLHLPPDERGRRGAEGSRVLTVLPRELLAFDWTFPPAVSELRRNDEKTHVSVFFSTTDDGVLVRLTQYGWREGPEWEAGYRYFDEAWGGVLQAMKAHLEAGDFAAPPAPPGMVESLRSFIQDLPRRLAEQGPEAWLAVLDSSSSFFMVTDGVIAFPNHAAAEEFLADFDERVTSLQARFENIRVDSLGAGLALFAASYDERIDLEDGNSNHFAGYVTGIARRTGTSWRMQHLHWSRLPTDAAGKK